MARTHECKIDDAFTLLRDGEEVPLSLQVAMAGEVCGIRMWGMGMGRRKAVAAAVTAGTQCGACIP